MQAPEDFHVGLSLRGVARTLQRGRQQNLHEGCSRAILPTPRPPLEGRLTAAQLKREPRRISYGQARLATKLGVNLSEVRHWLAGDDPVPHMVALDIRNLPSHTAPVTRRRA